MSSWSASRTGGDQLELLPRPPWLSVRWPLNLRRSPLDHRGIELPLVAWPFDAAQSRRTSATNHIDRIHWIGTEAERPQQACRKYLPVHFAVGFPELHFHLIVFANRADELWRVSPKVLVDVIAKNRLVE